MKYIFISLVFLLSFNIFSKNIDLTKNEKLAISLENKIQKINQNNLDLSNIKEMLDFVDKKENYSEEQIKVIKILSILNFEAMIFYDNEKELLNIAKKIFRPSMCGAYFFKDDFIRALNETNQFFIKNENDMNNLISSFKKMEDLFLLEAHKRISKIEVDFTEICSIK